MPGAPGEIRVCYANLPPAKCAEAAKRLKAGLTSATHGQFTPTTQYNRSLKLDLKRFFVKAGLTELREKGPAIFQ